MIARRNERRTTNSRRGVTLVEMLVTVAVLVIIMTILVQIFQAATGAMSAAQAYQQLDDQLRRLDGIIRSDLDGATARFTPPLNPTQNLGYFEYGENEFADTQGEDSDDYIRFTTKAPDGRAFTGRFWPANWASTTTGQVFQPVSPNLPTTPGNLTSFPITISSEYAEVIYFLRNGNLYRRVFLVVPDLQSAIVQGNGTQAVTESNPIFGSNLLSWQGVNDVSARPQAVGGPQVSGVPTGSIVLNTLGDLTNRENRAFYPRFASDFHNINQVVNGQASLGQDGLADDLNGDNAPDLYPSLYPGIFSPSSGQLVFAPPLSPASPAVGATALASNPGVAYLAFPYVFPGAYSKAQVVSSDQYGWIHAPSPYAVDPAGKAYQFDTQTLSYLTYLNHNPLDLGDNLPAPPANVALNNNGTTQSIPEAQTWWGFPTWRETLSPNWSDPAVQVNLAGQPAGLTYGTWSNNGGFSGVMNVSSGTLSSGNANLLPPMAVPQGFSGNFSVYRPTQQLFCDGAGASSVFMSSTLWPLTWEDDLIMTNVRSFDVKAYDNALANYADLGWGDDLRLYAAYPGAAVPSVPPFISGTQSLNSPFYSATAPLVFPWPPSNNVLSSSYNALATFAHEGRMPPMVEDNRLDYQNPNPTYVNSTTVPTLLQYPNYSNYSSNVGDDNPGIVRLRRVWDSWSTEYSNAPVSGPYVAGGGFPVGGPLGGSPPIYPSYPPPYPAPLRGLQIQIRVADPSNQRIKQLTIRQDFTDKL